MKGDRHTMKSLILTTQDARELDKLGGLTITKPIKPAPRYIEGASFSREADCSYKAVLSSFPELTQNS